MRLFFNGHVKQERKVDFDPADLDMVEEVMLAYFLQRMQFISLDNAYSDEDRTLVKLCEKYGVDAHYAPDRLAFFKAMLEEEA